MFLGKFPQLQKLYTNNEITEGLNILSLNYMPKLSKSSLGLSFQRSHSQPSISYLERKERELRIVHRVQVLATIADTDTMNNEDSDDGLQFKPAPKKHAALEASASKRRQPEDERPNTVFVGNISYRITAKELKRFFMKFGCVNDARVVKDHVTKLPRGIAFVTFENKSAATMAIEAGPEERTLDGREMRVFPAREKRMKLFKKEAEDDSEGPSQPASQESDRVLPAPAISALSEDALIVIFSHLKLDDLYEAQHVCRQWKSAAARCWASKKVLNFSNCFTTFGKRGMNDVIFREIVKLNGGNVRTLDVSAVASLLGYKSIELIAKVCLQLEDLNLSGSNATTIGVKEIANNCKDLKAVSLSRCCNIGEKGLWWVLHLGSNITRIDFGKNLRITGKCFYHMGANITVLNMTDCKKIEEYGFQQIGKRCGRLTELTLDGCIRLTSAGLGEICKGCPELRKLSVCGPGFTYLDSEGMGNIGQLAQLRELLLSLNTRVDDNALFVICSGCRQLEVLDLSVCGDGVSDAGLESFRECPNLSSLNIGYLKNVTDNTLLALAKVGRLEELKARGNLNVTGVGCAELLIHCPRLRLLDLSGCSSAAGGVLDSCLRAAELRDAGPQLVVVVGGSGIHVKQGFDHPLLRIDPMNLAIRRYFEEDYESDEDLLDEYDNEEDNWGGDYDDGMQFLETDDPVLEFERLYPS